jgi:HK97 family phage major capsid protein
VRDHDGNRHEYSLLKALRQMDPQSKGEHLDGLELEVHQELAKGRSRPARGVCVPWDLPVDGRAVQRFARANGVEQRNLTTSTGAGAVFTTVSTTMIEILRNLMLANTLGVRIMADMKGNFSIPKQTGTGTAYWVTEGNAPTASNQTIGAVNFTPSKTVGAFTDYSRRFLEQTAVDAEMFVRQDLAQVLAVEMDRVTFFGSGSGAEPQGIATNSSVTTVALGTNGAAPTYASMIALESAAAVANALVSDMAYVTNPKVRGTLKQTAVLGSTFPVWIWGADNEINGYPAYASNQIPSNLTKGSAPPASARRSCSATSATPSGRFWSGLDILVDPYTGGSTPATSHHRAAGCQLPAPPDGVVREDPGRPHPDVIVPAGGRGHARADIQVSWNEVGPAWWN